MSHYMVLNRDGANINWNIDTDAGTMVVVGDNVYLVIANYPDEGEGPIGLTTVTYMGTTETLQDFDGQVVIASCGNQLDGDYTETGYHVFTEGKAGSSGDTIIVRGGSASADSPRGANEAWLLQVDGADRVASSFVTYPHDTESYRLLDGEERDEFRWASDEAQEGPDAGGIYAASPFTGIKLADEPPVTEDPLTVRTVGWPGYVIAFEPAIPDPPINPPYTVFLNDPSDTPPGLTSYHGGPASFASGRLNQYFSNVTGDPEGLAVPLDFWDPTVGSTVAPTWHYAADETALGFEIVDLNLMANDGATNQRVDDGSGNLFYGVTPSDNGLFYHQVYTGMPILIGDDNAPGSYFWVKIYTSEGELGYEEVDWDYFSFWISGAYEVTPTSEPLSPLRFISARGLTDEDTDVEADVKDGDIYLAGASPYPQTDRLLDLCSWTGTVTLDSDSVVEELAHRIYTLALHWEEAIPPPPPEAITGVLGERRARFT